MISRFKQGKTTLSVNLSVDYEQNPDQIVGTVGDNAWSAALVMDRNVFGPNQPPPTFSGNYTMLLRNLTNAEAPAGDGYALIRVATNGLVTTSGAISDNTKLAHAVAISKDGRWPLFTPLYSFRYVVTNATNSVIVYTNAGFNGSIFGWLQVNNKCVTGDLLWTRKPSTNIYPGGFTNAFGVIGSQYIAPALHTASLTETNGTLTVSGNKLNNAISSTASLSTNNAFTIPSPNTNRLRATVTASSGLFQGSFLVATNKTATFVGVVLQQQNLAGGFFINTNESGKVEFNVSP